MTEVKLDATCSICGAAWIQESHYDTDTFVMVHDPYCEDAHVRKLTGAKEYARRLPTFNRI